MNAASAAQERDAVIAILQQTLKRRDLVKLVRQWCGEAEELRAAVVANQRAPWADAYLTRAMSLERLAALVSSSPPRIGSQPADETPETSPR